MGLFWFPHVGVAARYRGTYSRHWEASEGITVRVARWRQAAIGALLLAGLFVACRLGWATSVDVWATTSLITLSVILSCHERWLPRFPAGVRIGPEFCFSGSWRLDFEGVVGPRHRIGSRTSGWDREVQVVRVIACAERSVVRWDERPTS